MIAFGPGKSLKSSAPGRADPFIRRGPSGGQQPQLEIHTPLRFSSCPFFLCCWVYLLWLCPQQTPTLTPLFPSFHNNVPWKQIIVGKTNSFKDQKEGAYEFNKSIGLKFSVADHKDGKSDQGSYTHISGLRWLHSSLGLCHVCVKTWHLCFVQGRLVRAAHIQGGPLLNRIGQIRLKP